MVKRRVLFIESFVIVFHTFSIAQTGGFGKRLFTAPQKSSCAKKFFCKKKKWKKVKNLIIFLENFIEITRKCDII